MTSPAAPSRAEDLLRVTAISESSSSMRRWPLVKVNPVAAPANQMGSSHSAIWSAATVMSTVAEAEVEPAAMGMLRVPEAAVKSVAEAPRPAIPGPTAPTSTATGTLPPRALVAASKAAVTLAVTGVPFSVRVRG